MNHDDFKKLAEGMKKHSFAIPLNLPALALTGGGLIGGGIGAATAPEGQRLKRGLIGAGLGAAGTAAGALAGSYGAKGVSHLLRNRLGVVENGGRLELRSIPRTVTSRAGRTGYPDYATEALGALGGAVAGPVAAGIAAGRVGADKSKKAELDLALGYLWAHEGPGQTKHAAANYFGYRINREARDHDTLGPAFCKIAEAFHSSPWDLAIEVVKHYPELEKQADKLSAFYMRWAAHMVKKAGLLGSIGHALMPETKALATPIAESMTPRATKAVIGMKPAKLQQGLSAKSQQVAGLKPKPTKPVATPAALLQINWPPRLQLPLNQRHSR